MKQRKVGRSGLSVSELGLGTMTWGATTSLAQARELVGEFVGAGGNLIDTAPAYGGGRAEEFIGRMLRSDIPRDDLVIATKAGFSQRDGELAIDNSRRSLLEDLSGSLRRMETDHVDIWQVHAWASDPLDETLAALDQAVTSGMARYVGVSNFIGWQIGTAAAWQSAVPGRSRLTSAQVEYSLLARRAEIEVLPALHHHGMGFFPWSPVGRGVLTGKYARAIPRDSRAGRDESAWFVEPYLDARSRAVTDAVVTAAHGLHLSPPQVALLWVRDAPVVTAPLLGARNIEQLLPFLELEDVHLPIEIVQALDDVTGGPNQLRDCD